MKVRKCETTGITVMRRELDGRWFRLLLFALVVVLEWQWKWNAMDVDYYSWPDWMTDKQSIESSKRQER